MTELYNYYDVIKHAVFTVIRLCLLTGRALFWNLDGTYRRSAVYETSAHVQRVIWRSKKSTFECVHPSHFLTTHLRFDHPEITLADNVILTRVTAKEAFFVQLRQSLWNYTADKAPFCWIAIFEEAENVITMPISSLHRLAQSVGPIKTPSLLLSNQGRCGSTLLCKLMHLANRRVLALSEPCALDSLQDMIPYKERMGVEFDKIIESSCRLIFKPITGADAIVLKARLTAIRIVEHVGKQCPEVHHVYMLRRNLLKTVQSWQTAFFSETRGKMVSYVGKYCQPLLRPVLTTFFYFSDESGSLQFAIDTLNLENPFEMLVIAWSDNFTAYKRCSKTVEFHVIVYEDLLAQPEMELQKLFHLLNVDAPELKNAVRDGFLGDSQKGTPLAMAVTHGRRPAEYTPEVKKRVDKYLDAVGLPHLD